MNAPAVVWFRQDLRLADNPALTGAAAGGRPVLPVFVLPDSGLPDSGLPDSGLDDGDPSSLPQLGGAARWWLHHSLRSLAAALERLGAPLVLRRGPAAATIAALAQEAGASAVFCNRCFEPQGVAQERAVAAALNARGIDLHRANAGLLFEPKTLRTKEGGPFRVFTPFWKACLAAPEPSAPSPAPHRLRGLATPPDSVPLSAFRLLPTRPDWAGGLREAWVPGEDGGQARLTDFLAHGLANYAEERDRPDRPGTSRLSPHLHWGEFGPRQVWHAIKSFAAQAPEGGVARAADSFLRQLGWREFSHHLLHHFPDLDRANFRPEFDRFPWQPNAALLAAWQRGRTGYPIVDAGMRELWETGWMHNRVRMVAASFLVKHLMQPWQDGAAWFRDTLVDADLANNSANWQWVAGSGADAAPYFRIFNPVLQGERFDPDGAYVRRWLPALARLPDRFIHCPWTAPTAALRESGITLGGNYPAPIVAHGAARQRALAAFAAIRGAPPAEGAA